MFIINKLTARWKELMQLNQGNDVGGAENYVIVAHSWTPTTC